MKNSINEPPLKISFVGDISLGEHYFSFGHGPKTIVRKDNIFKYVERHLVSSDIAIGNLEGPLSNIGLIEGSPESEVFRGDPSSAKLLFESGFRVINIANNHISQHGSESFEESINALRENSVYPIGLRSQKALILSIKNKKIAFIGASMVPDNTDPNQSLYEVYSEVDIKNKIEECKNKADWIVVCLHWGVENNCEPTVEQIEVSEYLKDLGVNIVIGHHPHIFYELDFDISKRFLCAYSLGNFIFDLPWDKRMNKTGILDIYLTKNEIRAKLIPVEIGRDMYPRPCVGGKDVNHSGNFRLYDHKNKFYCYNFKKLKYFVFNLLKGKTKLKVTFFKDKILEKLKLIFQGF